MPFSRRLNAGACIAAVAVVALLIGAYLLGAWNRVPVGEYQVDTPARISLLESENFALRYITTVSLGYQVDEAEQVIPALEKLLDDPDERLRKAAEESLQRIRQSQ